MTERDGLEERRIADRLRDLMLVKLAERRDRGHWGGYSKLGLMASIEQEVKELNAEIEAFYCDVGLTPQRAKSILRECADVANYCAMLVDVIERGT